MTFAASPALEVSTEQQQAFSQLLEDSFNRSLAPGNVVVGEILSVDKDTITVDIGGKCEGTVSLRELPMMAPGETLANQFEPGHVREFYIIREFDEDHPFTLSLRRVDMWKDWEALREAHEADQTLEVRICSTTRGGVLVQAKSLKGFIPASQLRLAKTPDDMVGEVIPAKLLEVQRAKNKLILSHRAAVFEAQAERRFMTLSTLKEGQEMDGEVVKITNFGAFVDINGIDGLLPLSEISWSRLKHPSDMLELGQKLRVKVLTIDLQLERISLSMKRMGRDPWETVEDNYSEGQTVQGPISKMLNSGFLVELAPGIEAFCSYHQLNRDDLMMDHVYSFQIVSIAAADHRITLEPIQ